VAKAVRMKVTTQIVGQHDERVLVGSNKDGGFSWGGGEEILVSEELAANFEKSGIAERIEEKREAAALVTPEKAVMPAPKKRGNS
jgi:hypothetical protein